MKPIRTFTVVPSLPAPLEPLRPLSRNLRVPWNYEAIQLFMRLDSDLWERTNHNPVRMLGAISQAQLEAAAADPGFVAQLERVARDFQSYQSDTSTWFRRTYAHPGQPLIAYFSAEFGLTECLSIFAGGLGILAGDHLKSASDLDVPLVGVGLLYQQGYFRQYLTEGGWQQEVYENNDFYNLPITLERQADGSPLTVEVPLAGRHARAQVWRAQVGRIALYLLDTNIPANDPQDRDITDQLYGGTIETRIKQEIVLGIGGYRALEALGINPKVCHMNEGHSAFLGLERIRRLMERHQLSFADAREAASAGLVFTSHTPVAAGHDYFAPDLMERYFGDYARALGLSWQDFLGLGRQQQHSSAELFCMTTLALRLADYSNGVSDLHGSVTRHMWQGLWPGLPVEEVPIGHVTNGVHFRTWISHDMDTLYDRYLGPRWREEVADQAVWQKAWRIPAEELWRTHERRRERLIAFVRQRLQEQLQQRGAPLAEVEAADEVLDPEALTIGFARRFAAYKRAYLLLKDQERLARILNDSDRPVQVVFAGKAHPKDEAGKEIIRLIVEASRKDPFRRRLVFLENYDTAMARYLVQGCDVWLNNPRRPLEASGTSGMKAVANGVLHLSTLDGWWAEAWEHANPAAEPIGWSIGQGERYMDPELQDQVEAEALYAILEQDIVPSFYDRGPDDLPRGWIARMKASISGLCFFFNTHRMVREYTESFYMPAAGRAASLAEDDFARARALSEWKERVRAAWHQVRVELVDGASMTELHVGDTMTACARVHLGSLKPSDVRVELYLGQVRPNRELEQGEITPMVLDGAVGKTNYLYEAKVVCRLSGLNGYTVRVLPNHPDMNSPYIPGLITWAQGGDGGTE